jgi:hypothetical protein
LEIVSLFLLLVFQNGYLKEVAINTHPWGREIYSYMPPWIPHRLFVHGKKQGPKPTYSLVYTQKTGYCLFPPITTLHFFGL